MVDQPGAMLYTQGFGSRPENVEVPHIDSRIPSTSDYNFPIGKRWINLGVAEYILVGLSTAGGLTTATWNLTGTNTGPLNTLTGDAGGAIAPVAGNIDLLGTNNQIETLGSAGTVTFSVPTTFIAPGSIAATTTVTAGTAVVATTTVTAGTGITSTTGNIVATAGSVNAGTSMTATLGDITATNGNLVFGTAGNKIESTSVGSSAAAGANSFGKVTLTNGTVTVATTAVTANSIIMLTRQTVGTTGANDLGILSVGTIVAATSFVINAWTATNATVLQTDDQSNIGWMIIN